MRIAVVTTSWPGKAGDPSGHFVHAEARALERCGHQVVVVAPAAGGAFGWPGFSARLRHRPHRSIEAALWVKTARGKLARVAVDTVVAHWAVPCAWPIAIAAPRAALEVVSHGGDVRLLAALPEPARRFVVGAIASRAQRWRFVSHVLLDDLERTLDRETRIRVDRIADVQPVLLDMPDVAQAVEARRRALGGSRIGVSVGRLVASKRVDQVIEYAARTRDVDALVVVGDGPERKRLERLAHARGVDARFVGVVGRQDSLAWIGAADVVLHSSVAEGMSTVVREAAALGTRVMRVNG
jgi:teichuronic acid biosynthesis glycosyltransferase TuaC